uniref:Uncharacterized protein n=1 Tax=Chenopodium quinoa TaxID=63459 RepID=A0A803MJF9_CHEQI
MKEQTQKKDYRSKESFKKFQERLRRELDGVEGENPTEEAGVPAAAEQATENVQPPTTEAQLTKIADKEKVVPVPKKRKETPANVQFAKGKKIRHVQEDSDEEEQVAFRQRIPPAKFMKHVIIGLPEAHKQVVRDVGFGSFLLLNLDSNKNSFCHELVARFNPDRASLQLPNREEIEVLPKDVHAVFGLPIGGREIKDNKWIEEDEESQVMYFDRLKRGTAQPRRTIPLIAVWNKQMIQERMKVEKKRGFGQGKVLDRLTVINTNSGEENQGPSSSSTPEDGFILDEFNNISKELAGRVQSMYALIDKAYKLIEEVEIPDEMKELIRNVWGKYTSVQPTMSSQGIKTPGFLSQDENLFHEPAFLSELSDVMNKAWANFQAPQDEQQDEPPPENVVPPQATPHNDSVHDIVPLSEFQPNYNLFVGSQALPPTPPAKGKSPEQEESPTEQHLESLTESIVHKITMEHCEEPVT